MYGYIYLTTNLINNKKYIGRHKAKTFDNYYKGSGHILKEAIKKYGRENFKCEILEWCETKEDTYRQEKYWVDYYNAIEDPMFYNLTEGGCGPLEVPEDVKEKLRKAFTGESNPAKRPEVREKIRQGKLGDKNPMYGKHPKFSPEHKEKIGQALSGRKFSAEHCQKLSEAKLGKQSFRQIKVMCIETGVIYACAAEASKALNLNIVGNIGQCCRGIRKTAGGFHWKYIKDKEDKGE